MTPQEEAVIDAAVAIVASCACLGGDGMADDECQPHCEHWERLCAAVEALPE